MDKDMPGFIIPSNEGGNTMAPLEASTRIPLPIWAPGDGKTNLHHTHFYKKDFMNGPPAARAVRFSRLQRVRKTPHREYHDIFDGSLMPRTDQEAFIITVLSCAGYIPNCVVDMSSKRQLRIVELSPQMKATLQLPGAFTQEPQLGGRGRLIPYALCIESKI